MSSKIPASEMAQIVAALYPFQDPDSGLYWITRCDSVHPIKRKMVDEVLAGTKEAKAEIRRFCKHFFDRDITQVEIEKIMDAVMKKISENSKLRRKPVKPFVSQSPATPEATQPREEEKPDLLDRITEYLYPFMEGKEMKVRILDDDDGRIIPMKHEAIKARFRDLMTRFIGRSPTANNFRELWSSFENAALHDYQQRPEKEKVLQTVHDSLRECVLSFMAKIEYKPWQNTLGALRRELETVADEQDIDHGEWGKAQHLSIQLGSIEDQLTEAGVKLSRFPSNGRKIIRLEWTGSQGSQIRHYNKDTYYAAQAPDLPLSDNLVKAWLKMAFTEVNTLDKEKPPLDLEQVDTHFDSITPEEREEALENQKGVGLKLRRWSTVLLVSRLGMKKGEKLDKINKKLSDVFSRTLVIVDPDRPNKVESIEILAPDADKPMVIGARVASYRPANAEPTIEDQLAAETTSAG